MKTAVICVLLLLAVTQVNSQELRSYLYYTFNQRGDSTLEMLMTRSVETGGMAATIKTYFFNDTLRQIYDRKKQDSFYDVNGNTICNISYKWNKDKKNFNEAGKSESTYDVNGNLLVNTEYTWNEGAGKWTPVQKDECSFDERGDITLHLGYIWNSSGEKWYNYRKEECRYIDTDLLEITDYFRDQDRWIENFRSEIRYHYSGNMKTTTLYKWSNGWENYHMDTVFLDQYGNQASIISFLWNPESGSWRGKTKFEYGYHNKNDLFFYQESRWDDEVSGWIVQIKHDIFYDEEGNEMMAFYSTAENGYLSITGKSYIEQGPDIVIYPKGEMKVYPNPFSEFLLIGVPDGSPFDHFEIFNLSGRKLFTSSDQAADLSWLRNGFYLVRIKTMNDVVIGTVKVLKK